MGLCLGALLVALRVLNYYYLVRIMSFEFYVAVIGAIFMALGVWAGTKRSHSVSSLVSTPVSLENGKKINLSNRELEVLAELNNGLSNQEIADKLFVSLNTVKTHISNVYVKLHAKRRTQALAKAKSLKIIQ